MLDLKLEKELINEGYNLVAGIDEAGRGPLAGPVVAACVVFDKSFVVPKKLETVKDSKKLTPKKREELFNVLQEHCLEIGIGICDNNTIDRINILQAAFLAMKKAVGVLKNKPDFLLIDGGFKLPNSTFNQKNIVKGDNLVFSIAAASIIAKVTRDHIMEEYDKKYPQYEFIKHKGYGTKVHIENIKKYGPCPIHRMSFNPVSFYKN